MVRPEDMGLLRKAAQRLHWSGVTSASARREGAKELIAKVNQEWPKLPLIVISHSHGANLLLDAMSQLRNPPERVICLNAPFITLRKVALPELMWSALVGALLLLGVAVAGAIIPVARARTASIAITAPRRVARAAFARSGSRSTFRESC